MSLDFNSPEMQSQAARFAIDCRKIRLFLANNPGSTPLEIRKATKIRSVDECLLKMVVMGLVRTETIRGGGHTRESWFVVPQ